jgi:hypothetical protein
MYDLNSLRQKRKGSKMEIKELDQIFESPVVLNNKDLTTFVRLIIEKLKEQDKKPVKK